jgi:hypothetical protein
MDTNIPTVITDDSITVYIDGETYTVPRDWRGYDHLVHLLRQDPVNVEAVLGHVGGYDPNFKDHAFTVAEDVNMDDIEITRRAVFFKGQRVDTNLTRRLLDVQEAGLPIDPWLKFMSNVYDNPAEYARAELYDWVERSGLPITSDGCFLAYKRVADRLTDQSLEGDEPRYVDLYSRTFDNSPGQVVQMDRKDVDAVRAHHCSTGLHFCSERYLNGYGANGNGQATLIVKVNPADVVSIPDDYNFSKGRTWRYEVIQVIPDPVIPQEIEWDDPVIELDDDDDYQNDIAVEFDGNRAKSARPSFWKRAKDWWVGA